MNTPINNLSRINITAYLLFYYSMGDVILMRYGITCCFEWNETITLTFVNFGFSTTDSPNVETGVSINVTGIVSKSLELYMEPYRSSMYELPIHISYRIGLHESGWVYYGVRT